MSDEQISAIAGASHNTLVLAGAGTGKTTTIVGYVSWILKNKLADPGEILVLSYTNSSAHEMRDRIIKETGAEVRAGTFHSVGLEICQKATAYKPSVAKESTLEDVIEDITSDPIHEPRYRRYILSTMPQDPKKRNPASSGKKPSSSSATNQRRESSSKRDLPPFYQDYLRNFQRKAYTLVEQMRANNVDIAALRRMNSRPSVQESGRNADIIDLMEPIFLSYEAKLREENLVDFASMINQAIDHIKVGRYHHPYKYVLIDEYQDMSWPRENLIRALRQQRDFDLFCVGDDWQSIYRFAGSDINLILDFQEEWRQWGPTDMFQITTTRRFRQSIIDASGQFVMRDPALFRKRLQAPASSTSRTAPATLVSGTQTIKPRTDRSIRAIGGEDLKEQADAVAQQLRSTSIAKNASILLLGRYKSDVKDFIANSPFSLERDGSVHFSERPDLTIRSMTVHRSKGLQYDYVFILGCRGGVKGFPSTIPDDPLMALLLPRKETMPNAEERRLFYVAMTRCKRRVYFVVDTKRPSRFIYELRDSICPSAFRSLPLPLQCPKCQEATVIRTNKATGKTFRGCSAYPACRWVG